MGNLNPTLRDTEDFKHKLWDHLFIMSDFRLDVDSPYAQPSRQDLMLVPQKLRYPQSRIAFKHYGKYIHRFMSKVAEESKSVDTTGEMVNIARYMRTKSYEYNNDHPKNEAIVRDMRIMAGEELDIDMSTIVNMRSDYRTNTPQRNQKRGKQQAQKHNNRNKAAKGGRMQQRHHQSK
jgi:hypothetical protein